MITEKDKSLAQKVPDLLRLQLCKEKTKGVGLLAG